MDYKDVNDYEKLYLISENDEESINLVYEKYKPIIFSLAKKYYSKMNYHCGDLEDFVQEGYIGLDRAIRSFREGCNALFYTFSLVCIERQIKAYCRSFLTLKNENIYNAISLDLEYDENLKVLDSISDDSLNSNPDLYLKDKIILEKLIVFKHELPLKQSLVFELRYNGFKYKEISTLLDMPLSYVDYCLYRSKKKLSSQFTFL